MIKYCNKTRKILLGVTSAMLTGAVTMSVIIPSFGREGFANEPSASGAVQGITKKEDIKSDLTQYYDESVMQKLPQNTEDEIISVIIETKAKSVLDCFNAASKITSAATVAEYAVTADGRTASINAVRESDKILSLLDVAGVEYETGNRYEVVFGGVEILINSSDFEKAKNAVGDRATLIVGEVYSQCETQVVENDVNVYETGIFDSSDSQYDGTGTVIAVLDTGLDYTHTAFSAEGFKGTDVMKEKLTPSLIANTRAASFTAGLTAEDVYLNKKVPYAYDYADKDTDVYPIESEHGTHVSGVIVGKDEKITGVAVNAQLVSMKVFSDTTSGARTSWLLAALEDCVTLGVDVINMSLGTSSGFTREVDRTEVRDIYNRIGTNGISLVCAASNDYNSTFGSEKNGNLGLTSNPDTATVGSPSTYESALSVASISGVKTPYLKFGDTIMYFNEATGKGAQQKYFVDEILGDGVNEKEFEYVTISGTGTPGDYAAVGDVTGKIALVERGISTFEEKAKYAYEAGAVGIIIYNNVSGDISMTVGGTDMPVCSISQDNGKILSAQPRGTIKISREQVAGPFMSNFSSWGPTPDLRIKPEITAHGGDILSAVPGQDYDRLSGTSMASPNQAGVTALIRQYVKETFPELTPVQVTARVNQIMMSTTDIANNKNGLPYAVRKQGSGLANLTKATSTPAYLTTYDKNGNLMDKAKLELGDDVSKTGVYSMTFDINNFKGAQLTYDVSAVVMTEGVSSTLTHQGQTTVTEEGYALGASVKVKSVSGGTANGNTVTVSGNSAAKVTVEITLTDADKKYLDESFANGMYVEGFIKLAAKSGTGINLNVPYLAFYGDWTRAPMFDLDYFDTNKDEIDDSIDTLDKTLPDAYATRPVGGLYNDYISYLGSYNYIQNPTATKIAADRKYISLSNQATGDSSSTVHSINNIYAGLLRGAKKMIATVTDTVTGEVIFEKEIYNQIKSHNRGGAVGPSAVEIDFDTADYNLKNNTQYLFKLEGYLDYGEDGGKNTNLKNTFEFPFVADFEAPSITGCEFYTEYDSSLKKTRLFANINIYDNHYSQAAMVGYISSEEVDGKTTYGLEMFGRYLEALYSDFNSNYTLNYELTDYLDEIKKNSYNNNSFVVQVMDYAGNDATYEIAIPDEITDIYFTDAAGEKIEQVTLSPNEIYTPNAVVAPSESWAQSLDYTSLNEDIVRIVNGKFLALKPGVATVVATANGNSEMKKNLTVKVLAEGEEGFRRYDAPDVESFRLTEYYVNKVFYFPSSDDRDLGAAQAGTTVAFTGSSYNLTMFPSESVTIKYKLNAYFPESTEVRFSSGNDRVTVDENGTITAVSQGRGTVRVRVFKDGRETLYSQNINIVIKNPYETNAMQLVRYTGLGGVVSIPADLGITEIAMYAFPGYNSVPKDENDEISEEDPYFTKLAPIGDNTITKVIIPEGVETIGASAFAKLTALEEVVLPSTLTKIDAEAFSGCTSLKKINLEHVKFVNQKAFLGCPLEAVDLSSIVAMGDDAFNGTSIKSLSLPVSAQSIGARAFQNNKLLQTVTIAAEKVKLGTEAFADCVKLQTVTVNASVIPYGVFGGCTNLGRVSFGKDVAVIGSLAFEGTAVRSFSVDRENAYLSASSDGTYITDKSGRKLVLVAPTLREFNPGNTDIISIGDGAFSGNGVLEAVNLPGVTELGNYAFAGCGALQISRLILGRLTTIGDRAFMACASLRNTPSLADVTVIGDYAFASTGIRTVTIPDNVIVGSFAFADCRSLTEVTVGNDVVLGQAAFYAMLKSSGYMSAGEFQGYQAYVDAYEFSTVLAKATFGDRVKIGANAFENCTALTEVTLGSGCEIGDFAFYHNEKLKNIDLSEVTYIGSMAFSGRAQYLYIARDSSNPQSITRLGLFGSFAPKLETVDLGSATELGQGAFYMVTTLKSVTAFNEKLTKIAPMAFYFNQSLTSIDLSKIKYIGTGAFRSASALTSVNLSSAEQIGSLAFANSTALENVTLKNGVLIGDGAFMNDEKLSEINLGNARQIGIMAFAGAKALETADVSGALYIGEYAFMDSGVKEVIFGEGLEYAGDNPFAGCAIGEFENSDGKTTFDLSDYVYVRDGVLYATADNGGKVLISYPAGKTDKSFSVPEGVIRVGGRAFYGAGMQSVELPVSLKAIGDKAFFGCEKLTLVVFKSVQAPILEEEYDEEYQLITNFAQSGTTELIDGSKIEGLGIVPFKMWNMSHPTNFYYGANFVNYVGKVKNPLIMVRPSNGTGYNSFILGNYFDTTVDGATAPLQETLDAINAIASLPDYITLADEALVIAARAAYDKVSKPEQVALITNYTKLTSAESTIEYLKGETVDPGIKPPDEGKEDDNSQAVIIALSVLTGVFGAAAIATGVLLILTKRKKY